MGEARETSPLFSRLAQYKHSVKGTVKALIKASLIIIPIRKGALFGAKNYFGSLGVPSN